MVRKIFSAIFMTFWLVASSPADSVFLEDGSSVEGHITRETDTEVEMEVPLASGKSFTTRIIARKNISRIKKTTADEIAFSQLKSYRTLPGSSLTLAEYDQALVTLNKFITDFPGSTSIGEVQGWIAAWQKEQDQVKHGLFKISDSRLATPLWIPLAEAKPFIAWQSAYSDAQKKSLTLQSLQAQLTSEQAKRDKFSAGSGLIQPAIREAELKGFENRINALKPRMDQADRVAKASLEIYQKNSDPIVSYLDAQRNAIEETSKLMGDAKPRHFTLVAVLKPVKNTPTTTSKTETKPAVTTPTPKAVTNTPPPPPPAGHGKLIALAIVILLLIGGAAFVIIRKNKKSTSANPIHLDVKPMEQPNVIHTHAYHPPANPDSAAPGPPEVGFPVFAKRPDGAITPPPPPSDDRPNLRVDD